jgi:hypothetical protein
VQVFGACAIPFTIEKQTLLRLALPEVLEREINVYYAMVRQVSPFSPNCNLNCERVARWEVVENLYMREGNLNSSVLSPGMSLG